jgi:hypothetical protein
MSSHTTRVRASNNRASLYTEITDKIIAELEAGRISRCPSVTRDCRDARSAYKE